jgi:hypothetical protein
VTPEGRFGGTLVVSLVLWFPTLRGFLSNSVDAPEAMLRYLAAIGFAYFAMWFLDWVITTYQRANAKQMIEERRRAADREAEERAAAEAANPPAITAE